MLVLLLLLMFYSIHCNNESRSREVTEIKVKPDQELDIKLGNNKRNIESCGKMKGTS